MNVTDGPWVLEESYNTVVVDDSVGLAVFPVSVLKWESHHHLTFRQYGKT